jgi:hypothetical protein
MSAATQAQQCTADAATSKANALSVQMHHLIGVVKLAAFAAEARRTLDRIREVADCYPHFKQTIADHVPAMGDWQEREDNAGEVLDYVARQMDEVRSEFTETVHDLARVKKNGGAA